MVDQPLISVGLVSQVILLSSYTMTTQFVQSIISQNLDLSPPWANDTSLMKSDELVSHLVLFSLL